MPERKNTTRFDSSEVQGEGSFIVLRRLTVGESKVVRRENARHKDDTDTAWQDELSTKLLAEHITDWNWIGDDGQPLAKPSASPGVIDLLSDQELAFINEKLMGNPTPPSKS